MESKLKGIGLVKQGDYQQASKVFYTAADAGISYLEKNRCGLLNMGIT